MSVNKRMHKLIPLADICNPAEGLPDAEVY